MANVSHRVGYEKRDINIRFVAGIALLTIIVLVSMIAFLNSFFISERETQMSEQFLSRPNPQLLEMRAQAQKDLTSYKLLDAEKGIVQIPIERAKELLIKESAAGQ